jgi:hypothetical protein
LPFAPATSAAFYLAVGFGSSVQMAFESGIAELRARGIPEDRTPQLVVRPGIDPTRVILLGPTGAPEALDAGAIERPRDAGEGRVADVLPSRDRSVDSGFPLSGARDDSEGTLAGVATPRKQKASRAHAGSSARALYMLRIVAKKSSLEKDSERTRPRPPPEQGPSRIAQRVWTP